LRFRSAIEIKIDQESARLLIVPHQIAHQNIENVVIDWNSSVEARHPSQISDQDGIRTIDFRAPGEVRAILINGQQFLRHFIGERWTDDAAATYAARP
jgi:hypothetical protein